MVFDGSWNVQLEMCPPRPQKQNYVSHLKNENENENKNENENENDKNEKNRNDCWEKWIMSRENGDAACLAANWFALKKTGLSKIKCKKPFSITWQVVNKYGEKLFFNVSCAKWETLCILNKLIIDNMNKPLSEGNILQAISCAEMAGNELREWIHVGKLGNAENEDDDIQSLLTLVEMDSCFYESAAGICKVIYHAMKLNQYKEQNSDSDLTVLDNAGCFLTLILEAEKCRKQIEDRKESFMSHAYGKLHDFISKLEDFLDTQISETMVHLCRKNRKNWEEALFWKRRIVDKKTSSIVSGSACPVQEDYDLLVRLSGNVEEREPTPLPLPEILAPPCF